MLKKILTLFLFIHHIAWGQSKTENPSFRPLESFEQIFTKAAKEKKPVFFEAYLPTCSHCLAYDKTLRDPKIKSYLSTNFLAYQLDLSQRENGIFLRKNKIYVPSTPSFIVFSPEGKVINVEPVGDETNSVNGIQLVLNKAKDMNRNAIASLKKFDAGDQDFENMLSVALFARYTMDTIKNMEVVNKLANSIKPDQYYDKMSFLLMQRVMLDTDNKLFQYFIQNLPTYKQKFDSLEVKQTAENIQSIIQMNASFSKNHKIDGWVFGRVDYGMSIGYKREDLNFEKNNAVTKKILEIASLAKNNNTQLVVGGAISLESINILKSIQNIYLDRFETRKIIFSANALNIPNLKDGMVDAVHLELLWLKNKKNYYGSIFAEDDKRIEMLSSRWDIK